MDNFLASRSSCREVLVYIPVQFGNTSITMFWLKTGLGCHTDTTAQYACGGYGFYACPVWFGL